MPLLLNGQVLELLQNVTARQEMQSVSLWHVYSMKVRVCQLIYKQLIILFILQAENKNRHLWHRLFFILLKRA